MSQQSQKISEIQVKEALISMTTLLFIQEHRLLTPEQLADAKKSLQAMFLRASGEETMLRKLIEVLKTNKQLNQAFSDISKVQAGIGKSVLFLDDKITHIRQTFEDMDVSAEETRDFVGPFLLFAEEIFKHSENYHRYVLKYLELKEDEARKAHMYRIAHEARLRLRQRLSGDLGSDTHGELESKIKKEVIETFDYGETESNLKYAKRESRSVEKEINQIIENMSSMCQMVKNPSMREKDEEDKSEEESNYHDVYTLLLHALKKYPRLKGVKKDILELFKIFQHSHGMFRLDFGKLNKAIEPMINETEAYFEAKEEDEDIRAKRDKLEKIEALIPFLERTAHTLADSATIVYTKFSKKISDTITERKTPWEGINEELLRLKVVAEAELSTRI